MADEDVFFKLVEAEYKSLRDESAQARQAQQTTLQWSLAAVAGVLAAGLVFTNAQLAIRHPQDLAKIVYVLIFGFALQALALAGGLTYSGEIRRMERVGFYVRGIERRMAVFSRPQPPPLTWETFLQKGDGRYAWTRKITVPYIGALVLYYVVILLSVVFLWAEQPWMNDSVKVVVERLGLHVAPKSLPQVQNVTAIVLTIGLPILEVVLIGFQYYRVLAASALTANVGAVAKWLQ